MMQPILLEAEEAATYIIDFTELPMQMVFHAVMVLVLFFILGRLIFKPVLNMIKKREAAIQNDIDEAKKKNTEAGELRDEYEEKLNGIGTEREEILAATYKQARNREDEIIREARSEADRIRERARRDTEQEIEKAREELKNEAVELAGEMAEKIVRESLDKESQSGMLDNAIKNLEKQKWQQ